MNAYWRAANYLSVGQIYLFDNPLLKKPLKLEHVKPRLLGHFCTTPGLNVIFNRSHYEDVLVVRVHDLVRKEVWSNRYEQINNFENRLIDNNTHILKFFLHISKEEQLKRFKQRLDDPTKHWKISEADYKEREYWESYQQAYEDALSKCSTNEAPWFVIPSDQKWFRNLAISQIIVETMKKLEIEFPEPTVNIKDIRRKYHKAVNKEKKTKIKDVNK